MSVDRRDCLAALAALFAPVAARGTEAAPALAAAWDEAGGHRIGVLRPSPGGLRASAWVEVPTRAHGMLAEASGSVLAVARRPGDWLMRWRPAGGEVQRRWIEPDRAFNGHLVGSGDGKLIYTTETDLASGGGLVGVRDARTLAKFAEWPTHGADPHESIFDGEGRLLVANGGVETLPETGRTKRRLDRMDSSLVRLDAASGRLLGMWRLDDRRLGLRHLARAGERIGIALQAEHDDPAARAAAPVLALFDGAMLRAAEAPQPLAGYGGGVTPCRNAFVVGCPRAGGFALWRASGEWLGFVPLEEACAAAAFESGVIGGGKAKALWLRAGAADGDIAPTSRWSVGPMRLDNHWAVLLG